MASSVLLLVCSKNICSCIWSRHFRALDVREIAVSAKSLHLSLGICAQPVTRRQADGNKSREPYQKNDQRPWLLVIVAPPRRSTTILKLLRRRCTNPTKAVASARFIG